MAGTTLKGDAKARWRNRPNVQVNLAGEALTLDPVLDRLGELAASGSVPLGGLANLPAPGWIDGRADFKVDGLLLRDVLVKNAILRTSLEGGVLAVNEASGDLAGGTHVELKGQLIPGETPQFSGRVASSTDNLGALALWLESLRTDAVASKPAADEAGKADKATGDAVTVNLAPSAVEPAAASAAGRPFSASANVNLSSARLILGKVRMAYAKSTDVADLTGDVLLVARDDRVFTRISFDAKPFDFDPLRTLLPKDFEPKAYLAANDFAVKGTADRLTYDGRDVSGLELSASLTKGKLDLEQLKAARFAGAALEFSGVLEGVPQWQLDALTGRMSGHVTADKGGDFFSLFDIHAAGLDGPVDLNVDFSSGHAVDSEATLDTLTLKGSLGASRVDAVLKRAQASGDGADMINVIANAANADGYLLLKQMGIAASDKLTGAGSASLQVNGEMGKPYDTAFRLNVGAGTFTAKGKLDDPLEARGFAGQADVSASGVDMVMAALGAPDYLSDFVVKQASGPSFVASAKVVSAADKLSLDNLEVVTGNLHVAGDVDYVAGTGDKLPVLNGKIESNLLDLTPLYDEGAGDVLRWSPAALDLAPMSAFVGDVDLKVGQMRIGDLRLDDASMHLALADDVLSVVPMSAKMADGAATLTARIEGGKTGEPGIGLTFKLDGADLSKVGAQFAGASFATGRVSLELQAEAQGRSWLALVSSINGVGKVTTRDTRLAPLNVPGYSAALNGATSVDQLSALDGQILMSGETRVDGLDGDISIKDGLGRIARDELVLDGGKASLTAMLDIPRLALDSELRVTLDAPKDAPGISDISTGRIGAVERRVDTQALQQFSSRLIIARSIEEAGLKDLPSDLRDLIGAGAAKGPSVAGIPLPMQRPDSRSTTQ
jgi:hypothetical protein